MRHKSYFIYGDPQVHRGIRLRSKLELRAIMMLEMKFGLTLGKDLLYEPQEYVIDYKNPETGMPHQYHPDLYDAINNVIYEVKYIGKINDVIVKSKALATRQKFPGIKYVLLTNADLPEEIQECT